LKIVRQLTIVAHFVPELRKTCWPWPFTSLH